MVEEEIQDGKRTDRRSYLKKLVLGALGVGALLSLKEVPKAYAANSVGGAFSGIYTGDGNTTYDNYNFIGGGQNNTTGSNDGNTILQAWATVGGGYGNTASSAEATVGGGNGNTASGGYAAVGGGHNNTASARSSTVGGGENNQANNQYGTVGGGYSNISSGDSATVPGGDSNTAAGDYSFAAGRRAKINADHDGSFLFSDQNDFDFNSAAVNEFAVRATGGARFVTAIDGATGNPTKTIVMTPSGYLGVGTGSPSAPVHVFGSAPNPVVVEGDGSVGVSCMFDNYYGSGGAYSGGGFLGRMARGTKTSPANVAAGDRLGFNVFGGYAGGAFRHVAAIEALVDSGTVSATSLPSAIRFLTAPDGSISRLERMRINRDGRVGIGTASPTDLLDVNGNMIRVRSAKTPASSSDTGNAGEICWDSNYVYVCVAANTWKRAGLSTW